jgi:signal transduction histidine kinase
VLNALVDAAVELLHVDGAGLWIPDPDEPGNALPIVMRNVSADYVDEVRHINRDPAIRALWWDNPTLVTEDATRDARFPPAMQAAIAREGVRALLMVRVRIGEEIFGTFSVGMRRVHVFTQAEQRLLATLASRAALALQNARLYEQAQEAATREERQRLARELHDAVTQTLFSTALVAEVLPELWDLDPGEARQRLDDLRRMTRGALAEMRTLLVELRPGVLTELTLADLVRQLGEATAGRTRLEVATTVHGTPHDLPASVQIGLYRIVQEALNNVVKHAGARQVELTLRHDAKGGVQVDVTDDGRGFDTSCVPAGHLGMGIMRERAETIGARLKIASQSGRGTCVEVSWQLPRACAEDLSG